MDITVLAAGLCTFFNPMLPYLVKGGEKLAEQAAEKLGHSAWDKGKQLWQSITSKAEAESLPLETAAQDLLDAPEDEDAQAAFRMQLKKLLKQDESFAAEIAQLLEESAPEIYSAELQGSGAIAQGEGAVAAGGRGVAVGGSVSGSVIVTGDKR